MTNGGTLWVPGDDELPDFMQQPDVFDSRMRADRELAANMLRQGHVLYDTTAGRYVLTRKGKEAFKRRLRARRKLMLRQGVSND